MTSTTVCHVKEEQSLPRSPHTRRLRTIGVFAVRHWPLLRPDKGLDQTIYCALKRAGFRETVWQFVYAGQLGGLVLPLEGGIREIHVRFYADIVEAELEVGRHFLAHFFRPQYQAEGLVLELVKHHVGPTELRRMQTVFRKVESGQEVKLCDENPRVSFTIVAALLAALAFVVTLGGWLPVPAAWATAAFVQGQRA